MLLFLRKLSPIFFYAIISVFILNSCAEDPFPGLNDNLPASKPKPVITSIDPPEALGGVTQVTIAGSNFSPNPAENFVSFNGKYGKIISASSTQLVVIPPNVIGNSVYLKIAVQGAVDFSDTLVYTIKAASEELFGFQNFEKPYGMTVDNNSNVYLSLVVNGIGDGVKKITPTDSLYDFAPKGAETFWSSLKIGPAGILFGAKDLRGIWKIDQNIAPPNQPYIIFPSGTRIYDFDYDMNGNIWAVGNNTNIFFVASDLTPTGIEFSANLKSVRVFENNLYVAGLKDNIEGVWRFPINGNTLGNSELYFNLSETFGGKALAITFAADGDMYIGTDATESIIVVHPDKSSEPLYPGIFIPLIQNFCWGTDTRLYATKFGISEGTADQTKQTVLVIEMQKTGAPYYGRN